MKTQWPENSFLGDQQATANALELANHAWQPSLDVLETRVEGSGSDTQGQGFDSG